MELFNEVSDNSNGNSNINNINKYDISVPLPERVRPRTILEFVGQKHLIGNNSPFTKFFESGNFPSIIFWGPPGTGKTTLSNLIANHTNAIFVKLSATDSGIKDIRLVIENAKKAKKSQKQTILFIDEIHRFNKSQQDILLDAIEKGHFVLIGATTENPSFEINPAILSRCNVYILKNLIDEDIQTIINNAIDNDFILKEYNIKVIEWEFLFRYASGDSRASLKALETVFLNFKSEIENFKKNSNTSEINNELFFEIANSHFETALQQNIAYYDKKSENHYDNISALIKSLRGSDPDAAMIWVAKMLINGEDPKFIVRRLIIFASEDIGNADPNALNVAINTFRAVEVIGMPECRINIGQAIIYLALAPKSNASYMAIEKAFELVKNSNSEVLKVPMKLRNSPTKFMKNIGYGENYKNPHDYKKNSKNQTVEDNFIENENYFPESMKNISFYNPTNNGIESKLKERYKRLWGRIE